MTSQIDKARHFRSLHRPGAPLVLYNIWDAGSARALARMGARAIGTSSWSVAAAQGYEDGEALPLEDALAVVARIARSTPLPLTVDFEGGYAADPETLAGNLRRLLALGVVGLNFEDQRLGGPGLHDIPDQVARLRALRAAADAMGVPAFINARTDVFLKAAPDTDHATLMDEALDRAAAYAEAGADGFFVPGLTDRGLIRRICDSVTLPVNLMLADPGAAQDMAGSGVSRISFGPHPYIALMAQLERDAAACV